MGKPTLILCSDIHLREDQPLCRLDDFITVQFEKLCWLQMLQEKYDCPVVCAGDLFHFWKPSPSLLTKTIRALPNNFWTVYGQHDLPQHNLELQVKSGVYTLATANKLQILNECHWGQEPTKGSLVLPGSDKQILVMHRLTWKTEKPWPTCMASNARTLLKKYPQFDLIVTGDNHQTFVETLGERILVNPGSFTRQKADQKEHKPCVFLWFAKTNSVEQVFVPIKEDVVSTEHIEAQKERDGRIDAFITRLTNDWEVDVNFQENLKRFFIENPTRQSVYNTIYASLEKGGVL